MLRAADIHVSIGPSAVLQGASLEVDGGEVVGLAGANGAGKSTLLRALAGLRPASGGVRLDETDVAGWLPERRARLGLGHLDQGPSAFRGLSVRDNLRAVLECGGEPDERRVDEELSRMGLADLADRRADRLSGGERRRLEVARALCRGPRWLLLDEPLAGLDEAEARRVARRLRDAADDGVALLVASPEPPADLCDRALRLRSGRVEAA